jgi:hypothetical protein
MIVPIVHLANDTVADVPVLCFSNVPAHLMARVLTLHKPAQAAFAKGVNAKQLQ